MPICSDYWEFKCVCPAQPTSIPHGGDSLSPQFLAALDDMLKHHELVKSEVRRIQRAEEGTRSTARRKEPQSFGHAGWQGGCALPAEAC